MTRLFSLSLLALLVATSGIAQQPSALPAKAPETKFQESPIYEMRVYYANPGKLEDLNTRFRTNTMRIFVKHGMTNVGYWIPVDNPENKLVYLLSYPSKEARDASWKAFSADPEWQAVAKASEANGKIVAKVESTFLRATDYSPKIKIEAKSPPRLFEMRTYYTTPNNLENLHDRFRGITLKQFKKHNMESVIYLQPMDSAGVKPERMVYFLAHKDRASADANWKAFREDPTWVAAKTASETRGGGSLTSKVDFVFMKPTDYSPIK